MSIGLYNISGRVRIKGGVEKKRRKQSVIEETKIGRTNCTKETENECWTP